MVCHSAVFIYWATYSALILGGHRQKSVHQGGAKYQNFGVPPRKMLGKWVRSDDLNGQHKILIIPMFGLLYPVVPSFSYLSWFPPPQKNGKIVVPGSGECGAMIVALSYLYRLLAMLGLCRYRFLACTCRRPGPFASACARPLRIICYPRLV